MRIIKAKISSKKKRGKAQAQEPEPKQLKLEEQQHQQNDEMDTAESVNVNVPQVQVENGNMHDYKRKTSKLPAAEVTKTKKTLNPHMETPTKSLNANSLFISRTPSPPVLSAYTPGIEVRRFSVPNLNIGLRSDNNLQEMKKRYNSDAEDDGKILQQIEENVIDPNKSNKSVNESTSCLQPVKTVIATNHKSQNGKERREEVTNIPVKTPIFSSELPAGILKLNDENIQMNNTFASNSKNIRKKRVTFSDQTYICYFSSEIFENSRKRKFSQTGQRIKKRLKIMASTINNKLNEKGNANQTLNCTNFLDESKINEVLNNATNLLSVNGYMEPTEEIKLFRKRKDTPIKPSTASGTDQKLNRSVKGRRLSFLNNSSIESLEPSKILRSRVIPSTSTGRKNLDKAKSSNAKKGEKEGLLREKEKRTTTTESIPNSNELVVGQNTGLPVLENVVDQPSTHAPSTSKIVCLSQPSNTIEEKEESRKIELVKTIEKENCSNSNNEKTDGIVNVYNPKVQNETTNRSQEQISETGLTLFKPILNFELNVGSQINEKDLQLANSLVKALLDMDIVKQNPGFLIDMVLKQYKSPEELITFVKELFTKKFQ